MSIFSDEFLTEVRSKLEQQRQELVAKGLDQLQSMRQEGRWDGPRDSIDESVAEQVESTQLRLKDREKKLLLKVEDAIKRFDAGEFGYCEECGDPIEEKRLLARPMTTMCIECKEDQEREERLNRVRPGLLE